MLLGILHLVSQSAFATGLPTEAFSADVQIIDYDGANDAIEFPTTVFSGTGTYTYSDGSSSPPLPTSTVFIDRSLYVDRVTSSSAYGCGTEATAPYRFLCWGLSQQHMPTGLVSATGYTVGSTTEEGVLNYDGNVVLWYSGTAPSSPYTTTSDIPGTGYTGLVVTREFAMGAKPGDGLYYTGTNRNGLLSTVAARHRDGETDWALVASRYWYGGYNGDGDDFFVECPTSGTYVASCGALSANAPIDGVDYDSAAGVVPKVADASQEGEFLAVVWYTDYTASVWTSWTGAGLSAGQIEYLPGFDLYGGDPDKFTPCDDDGEPIEWAGPLHIGHHDTTPSIVGVLNADYTIGGDYLVQGTTIVVTNIGMFSYAP